MDNKPHLDRKNSDAAVNAIYDCVSGNVWKTALRIRDILIGKGSMKNNPYIKDYKAFMSLLYLFVSRKHMQVCRFPDLGNELYEESDQEPTLIEDLSTLPIDVQAAYISEWFLENLLASGESHESAITFLNGLTSEHYIDWVIARKASGLKRGALFYKISGHDKDTSEIEIPELPIEIV